MKKVKKLYRENRILFILLIVVVVCVIVMGVSLFKYFYVGTNDKWGDRLEGIEQVELTETRLSDITMQSKSNNVDKISDIKVTVTGKRVDFIIYVLPSATITDAQAIASKTLENFTDEEKAFYDFNYALVQNATAEVEGFTIEGTRTAGGSGKIEWTNNVPKDDLAEPNE